MGLHRLALRSLLRHPWQTGLSVLGIALGVAVVVAIDLANGSAQRAFQLSVQTLAGETTHRIVGGPAGLDEAVYRPLRLEWGIRRAAPVIEGRAAAPQHPGWSFRLLGVDPFAEAPFRGYGAQVGGQSGLEALLTRPATALILEESARALGLSPGGTLTLRLGQRQHTITIVGYLQADQALSRQALSDVLVMDIAAAQELLGRVGRLSQIDLILSASEARFLATALPQSARLIEVRTQTSALRQMTRAFHTNLTAMSLLALVVGMFIIFNTMTFSVVQRRATLGTLRALGVTRGGVLRLVLSEALALGVLGTAEGLLLGVVLGQGLLQLVSRTINDLYFTVNVTGVHLGPWSLAKGIGLGLGAALLASLPPALEAAHAPPRLTLMRSAMESRARRLLPRLTWSGLGLFALGLGLLAIPSRSLGLSYSGLFVLLMGYALMTPAATVVLMTWLRPLTGRLGTLGRLAPRTITAGLSRTGVAVSALMIAVATMVGVGIMIGSFRQAVELWVNQSLRADIYVSIDSEEAGTASLPAAYIQDVAGLDQVQAVSRGLRLELTTAQGPTTLLVLDVPPAGFAGFEFKDAAPEAARQAFDGGQVLISEPYAYHHGLQRGESLTLPTDDGPRPFTIAGVFYDYSSDRGVVAMARDTYLRHWNDRRVASMGVFLQPGLDAGTLLPRLRDLAPAGLPLNIRPTREIRAITLEVFDRTFAITEVLRLLTVVVAVVGILSALLALQMERARELGVLRATGVTPWGLWRLVSLETGLMGLAAGLLALPLGVVLSLVLIFVINRRSFGWSMVPAVEPGQLMLALATAVAAALAGGLYATYRMARTPPAAALRSE